MIIYGSWATLTKICYDLKAGFVWERLSKGQWPGDQLKSSPYRDKIMNQDQKNDYNRHKSMQASNFYMKSLKLFVMTRSNL